ncbi:MAG TPA: ABC transporter permease subunit [Thermoanaerobaculia bacterium]|jgi:putative spermidine/putrescine transport system permease protein|nr:ABC transporter permease subunit [Thermoanaerobaculia bacterium]
MSTVIVRRAGIAATAVLALALLTPVVVTAAGAFSGADAESVPDLILHVTGLWGGALLRSVEIVATVVPLALAIGAPAAWAFRRRPFPGSRLLESAALVPLAVPGVALAFSLIQVAGSAPRFALLVVGHLAYTLPMVVKTVTNAVETFDLRLEPAARSLGATGWETAVRVTVPLLMPALVLSSLLVFAVSWGEFNVSFLLATPLVQTFPAALYVTYTTNSFPVAAAATLIFLAPVVPALFAIQALGGEEFHRGLPA